MNGSFNQSDSATEFNDVSVISCFTGWLPEPLPLRFGHIGEVWKFLKETLPKYQWAEEKAKAQLEEELMAQLLLESEMKEEANAADGKEAKNDPKDKKKAKGNSHRLVDICQLVQVFYQTCDDD